MGRQGPPDRPKGCEADEQFALNSRWMTVARGGNDWLTFHNARTPPLVFFLIGLLILGLIAGFIARALVPGPDPRASLAPCS